MAAGEAIGCFGLTEPDCGQRSRLDAHHRPRATASDWILNGTKMWITNGSIADVAVVWARTDDRGACDRGFVVPTDTPGFTTNDIHKKLSLRASITSELVLDDVRLPAAAVLPEVSTDARARSPASTRPASGSSGAPSAPARACYEAALDYAKERVQFGKPIASFQLTQRKLVEMMVRVNKAELVALHLGRMKDEGRLTSAQVSFGKMDNVREALEVAREARVVLGANGITLEYPVIRHMNNLESVYHLRGHQRDPHAGPRPGHHRARGVRRRLTGARARTPTPSILGARSARKSDGSGCGKAQGVGRSRT